MSTTSAFLVGQNAIGKYAYSDYDGDVEMNSVFKWYRNGQLITGVTGKEYYLAMSDKDKKIKFCVEPHSSGGYPISTNTGTLTCSDEKVVLNPINLTYLSVHDDEARAEGHRTNELHVRAHNADDSPAVGVSLRVSATNGATVVGGIQL